MKREYHKIDRLRSYSVIDLFLRRSSLILARISLFRRADLAKIEEDLQRTSFFSQNPIENDHFCNIFPFLYFLAAFYICELKLNQSTKVLSFNRDNINWYLKSTEIKFQLKINIYFRCHQNSIKLKPKA